MPGGQAVPLKHKSGKTYYLPSDMVADAVASGEYEAPGGDAAIAITDSQGSVRSVPYSQLGRVQNAQGRSLASQEDVAGVRTSQRLQDEQGGLGSRILTGIEGALDTATFGGYSAGARLIDDDYADQISDRRDANPKSRLAGEIIPSIATGVAAAKTVAGKNLGRTGSALVSTPAGAAAKGAERLAEGGVLGAAVGYGAEGAAISTGQYITDVALGDKELSAEAFLGSAGEGLLWGSALGGGAKLAGAGAKKVGDRIRKTEKAAESAGLARQLSKRIEGEQKKLGTFKRRVALSDVKQAQRIDLHDIKNTAKLTNLDAANDAKLGIIEAQTAAKKELEIVKTSGRMSAEDAKRLAKLEVIEASANSKLAQLEAKQGIEETRVKGRIATADASKARTQAKQAATDARVTIMDKRLELADKYTAGWRDVNELKLKTAGVNRNATEIASTARVKSSEIAADAKTRTGLADAIAKSDDVGRVDIRSLVPENMRSVKAQKIARETLATSVDDLKRTGDEVIGIVSQIDAPEAQMAAQRISAAADNLERYNPLANESQAAALKAIQDQEAALYQSVQDIKPYVTPEDFAALEAQVGGYGEKLAAKTADSPFGGLQAPDALAALGIVADVEDMPVLGPVAAAWLAYRGAGALGWAARGPLASVAQRAAGLQNKVSQSIGAFVKGAERQIPKIRGAATPAAILSRPLYSDSETRTAPAKVEEGKPEAVIALYKQRLQELTAAANDPERVRATLARTVPTGKPAVQKAIEEATLRKLQHLYQTAPKDPMPPSIIPSRWQPNNVELSEWAERVEVTEDPNAALDKMQRGELTPVAADTLRTVFPRLFSKIQEEIIDNVAELREDLPYSKQVQLSILFDVPVDYSMRPEVIAALQEGYQTAPEQNQGTSLGGSLGVAELSEYGPLSRQAG